MFLSFLLKGDNVVPVLSLKGRQYCSCKFFQKGDNVVPGIFIKWRQCCSWHFSKGDNVVISFLLPWKIKSFKNCSSLTENNLLKRLHIHVQKLIILCVLQDLNK